MRRSRKHTKRHRRRRGGAWYDPRTWFQSSTAPILPEPVAKAPVQAAVAVEKTVNDIGLGPAKQAEVLGTPPSTDEVLGTGGRRRRTRKHRRRH
jgi:hypothetical protein